MSLRLQVNDPNLVCDASIAENLNALYGDNPDTAVRTLVQQMLGEWEMVGMFLNGTGSKTEATIGKTPPGLFSILLTPSSSRQRGNQCTCV